VPKSPDISSTCPQPLTAFGVLFQHEDIDDVVKACLLDSWAESTRGTRKEESDRKILLGREKSKNNNA
jgi:hypothetical protein